MVQLFSIVALFIMFRETLEACVVVSIMLNMVNRLGMPRMKRQVWYGVLAGVLLSASIGTGFIVAFYVTKNTVFKGEGQAIFKGYIDMVATLLIAILGFAMLRFLNYERKWQRKLETAARQAQLAEDPAHAKRKTSRKTAWAIFLLCFSAVFREGLEAMIFLAGVGTSVEPSSIPIAGLVGILIGVVCGLLLFYTGRQIKDLWWFFILSFILLFMIGAGLISNGMSSWQSIGWFGTFYPTSMRPWWNQPVWDTCGCCSDNINSSRFFGLMNALFGYQCQPTFISLFSYFAFWGIILFDLAVKYFRGGLFDAEYKSRKRAEKRARKLGLPLTDLNDSGSEDLKMAALPESDSVSASSSGKHSFDALETANQAARKASGKPATPAAEAGRGKDVQLKLKESELQPVCSAV